MFPWPLRFDQSRSTVRRPTLQGGLVTYTALAKARASDTSASYRRLKLWFTRANLLITAGRIYVVSKSTVGIRAALHDFQFVWQEHECDFATLCVGRFEGSNIAVNYGFAGRKTGVHALDDVHIKTIELNLKFVVTQSENAELALIEAIDTVDLRGGHDDFLGRPLRGWILWSLRGALEAGNQDCQRQCEDCFHRLHHL